MFHFEHVRTKIVQTKEDLNELRDKMLQAKYCFFDTETSGLKVKQPGHDFIVGFTVAFEDEVDDRVFYVPLRHDFEGVYDEKHITAELMNSLKLNPANFPKFDVDYQMYFRHNFHGKDGFTPKYEDMNYCWENVDEELFISMFKPIFEMGDKTWIAHHLSFDLHVIANMGIDISKMLPKDNYDDTMLIHHTYDEEGEKKLEKIVESVYGIKKIDYDDVVATVTAEEKKSLGMKASKKATFNLVQIPVGAQYSAEDVWYMKDMYHDMLNVLEEDEQLELYRLLRIPFLMSLWKMERRGIRIDLVKVKVMEAKAKEELDKMKYAMYEIIGDCEVNFNSGQQMAELLYGHKKKMKDKKAGGYKESFNQKYIDLSFGFPITHWTEGGKEKDKELKSPQINEDSLNEILKKEYKKDKRKMEGQELVKILLKYKRLSKLYEAFIIGLQEQVYSNGRVHPSFNQCGTDSWRLSCSDPNLQQLPRPLEKPKEPKQIEDEKLLREMLIKYNKELNEYQYWHQFEIRDLIIPDDDDMVIVSCDYSNLEKRITAHMTEDEKLVELLINGYDGHGFVATLIFDECKDLHPNEVKKKYPHLRQIAKGIGFAMDYGGTEFTVSKNLGISKEEARKYIDKYFEGFCGLAEWGDNQKRFGRKFGYVQTLLGHKRHVPGIRSDNMKIKSYYERIVLNAPIQGSAGDIISLAQIAIDADPILRLLNCTLRIQIHDELVAVCPRKYVHICMERMKYFMANALPEPMIVPLFAEADYSDTYAGAH